MINRYSRKPVSNAREICGLSRSSIENHPLPEPLEEHLSPSPIPSIKDTYSTCSSESETYEDTSNQTLLGDVRFPWSVINSYTETGISTECSSVFSWGDDEFEKAASQQVQQMFCEIEEFLFEGKKCSRIEGLEQECQEWKSSFQHFRILGTQVMAPVDEAYQWYASSVTGTNTSTPANSPGHERDANELFIVGTKVLLSDAPQCKIGICTLSGEEDEEAENGVIIADGLVEEYLAFDHKDLEDDCYEKRMSLALQCENRLGMPPVSPVQCTRSAIMADLFDEVWREVMGCMKELIRKHWEVPISDDERGIASVENVRTIPVNSALPLELFPRAPHSQLPAFNSYLLQSQGQRLQGGAVHRTLNSLKIQGISLQQRTSPLPEKTQSTASDRLSTSALPPSRNTLLPPIVSPETEHLTTMPIPRLQKMRVYANRAHSAVMDETSHLLPRDRFLGDEYYSRPSTTHVFQSETSYRRSFTVLDNAHQMRVGRGSAGPDSLSIGVTGISLSVSSSSHLDMLPQHSLRHSATETEEAEVKHQLSLGPRVTLPMRPHSRGGTNSRSRREL
ncbi:protein FAM149B1 isoform X4 [Callorhinchus milii]|uniref:protein FAM149B1 isoform X4 n=1 Tax=Callorhinchus milii TaxID=7868 RepID=UPI001C3F8887|nr:protein FAM149B1 isoform X4 [Callorhinchus milii]